VRQDEQRSDILRVIDNIINKYQPLQSITTQGCIAKNSQVTLWHHPHKVVSADPPVKEYK
jgi:hypothetical protein